MAAVAALASDHSRRPVRLGVHGDAAPAVEVARAGLIRRIALLAPGGEVVGVLSNFTTRVLAYPSATNIVLPLKAFTATRKADGAKPHCDTQDLRIIREKLNHLKFILERGKTSDSKPPGRTQHHSERGHSNGPAETSRLADGRILLLISVLPYLGRYRPKYIQANFRPARQARAPVGPSPDAPRRPPGPFELNKKLRAGGGDHLDGSYLHVVRCLRYVRVRLRVLRGHSRTSDLDLVADMWC
jgi:hypothetical protein